MKKNIIFLLAVLSSLTVRAQRIDQIINSYVAFIGGEKKWSEVKTITTSGEYDYGGAAFPFTTLSKAPHFYKFIVPFNGRHYTQAFDGTKGWKMDAFKGETKPTLLTGKPARALANEADVELEDPLINYKAKGHQAILEGKDTIDNRSCFKVKFTRKNGEVETYYLDSNNYEIVMKEAVSKNAEMEGAILNTFYSDYRDVKGIKLPFKAISKSNEQTLLTITMDKAELNKPIDNKEFQP